MCPESTVLVTCAPRFLGELALETSHSTGLCSINNWVIMGGWVKKVENLFDKIGLTGGKWSSLNAKCHKPPIFGAYLLSASSEHLGRKGRSYKTRSSVKMLIIFRQMRDQKST